MKAARPVPILMVMLWMLLVLAGYAQAGAPGGLDGISGAAHLVSRNSGRDRVGRGEDLRASGKNDALFQLELTAPGATITGIELKSTNGRQSLWDTFPGNGHWLLAVSRKGRLLNRPDGSLRLPLGQGREILDLEAEDNGSIEGGRTSYLLTVFFANGVRVSFPVQAGQTAGAVALPASGSAWLPSGKYFVQAFTSREWQSDWTLYVRGGQITGSSKWECCPGPRVDPLRGTLRGETVAIVRDCSGQGYQGPCRQVYTGQRVSPGEVKGSFTLNGRKIGTWVLHLPYIAPVAAPAASAPASGGSGYLVEVTAKDIFMDLGAKRGARKGDRFTVLDGQGEGVATLVVRRAYPEVSLMSLAQGRRNVLRAGQRVVRAAKGAPAPTPPPPPAVAAPKPVPLPPSPATAPSPSAGGRSMRIGVLPAIMETQGSLISLDSAALPAEAVARALNVYRPLTARALGPSQAQDLNQAEGAALEMVMERLGLDAIVNWGVSQQEYDERATVFVVLIRRGRADQPDSGEVMVDADRVLQRFGRLVTRLVGESLGYI